MSEVFLVRVGVFAAYEHTQSNRSNIVAGNLAQVIVDCLPMPAPSLILSFPSTPSVDRAASCVRVLIFVGRCQIARSASARVGTRCTARRAHLTPPSTTRSSCRAWTLDSICLDTVEAGVRPDEHKELLH